nr:hypothetical protein [Polyangium spumosum]
MGLDAHDQKIDVLAQAILIVQMDPQPRLKGAHRAAAFGEVALGLGALEAKGGRDAAGLPPDPALGGGIFGIHCGRAVAGDGLHAGERLLGRIIAHAHRRESDAPCGSECAHDLALRGISAEIVEGMERVPLLGLQQRDAAGVIGEREDAAARVVLEEVRYALFLEQAGDEIEVGLVVLGDMLAMIRVREARGVVSDERPAERADELPELASVEVDAKGHGLPIKRDEPPCPAGPSRGVVPQHGRDDVHDATMPKDLARLPEARAQEVRGEDDTKDAQRACLLELLGLGEDAMNGAYPRARADAEGRAGVDEGIEIEVPLRARTQEGDVIMEGARDLLDAMPSHDTQRAPALAGAEEVICRHARCSHRLRHRRQETGGRGPVSRKRPRLVPPPPAGVLRGATRGMIIEERREAQTGRDMR